MQNLYLLVLLTPILRLTAGADWCYYSQVSCNNTCKGPNKWVEVASTCGGTRQSPINIVTQKTVTKKLEPFKFSYKNEVNCFITNNGHTAKVSLSGESLIMGGELKQAYKAMEIHFHWGKSAGLGSEHTINGEQYPMEMHIVHIKDSYSSVKDAGKDPSGIAVLGFLYEEAEAADNTYDSIINALPNITHYDNSSSLGTVNLMTLIPETDKLANYFRYNGSLTTPNCMESVIWTVFEKTINISKQQVSAFYKLQFENGNPMVGIFRPVQPLHGREVFYSGSNFASFSMVLITVSFLISFFSPM